MKNRSLFLILLLALFAPWAANAQKALPYSYGFENNDLTSEGWTKQATSSSTGIYNSSSASHDGSYLFRFNYSENPAYLVSPLLTGTTTGVDVVFYYANYSNSYKEKFQVGYTTDESVTDPSAFTYGEEITCQTLAPTYSTYENTFPAQTKRIAIKYIYTNGYYLYLDDFSFTASSGCAKPTGLAATLTQGNGTIATLSWTENGEAEGWTLQYGTDNTFANCTELASGFTIEGTTVTANLTGLTPEQKLYARVKPDCDTDGTKWSNEIEFKPTNAIPQTVCDGTTTNSYIPVYGNYAENYNKDEFIIPATTEGMATMASGTIKGMTFYLSSPASDLWGAALYRVFMKEVNESSFASTSYYGTDGATIVYEGALDGTQPTMTIEFTRDYEYNGGNLLVGIYEYNKGSFKSCSFYGITSTNGSMYKNSSTSLESITSGTLQNFIPKTTFIYLPSNTPKPRNIQVSDITASQATVSWEAPATGTPTGYEYQIKVSGEEWPTSWINAENNLSVEPTGLTASTDYVVRVRAIYAEGESGSIETEFRTLDACAFPTNFTATTVPGVGTDANFSWVKGYDETAWVLQIATDADFTTGVVEFTEGFVVDGNNVTFHATTLTPEQTYYAHVKANCDGPTSVWSNVETFTPSNYVDYTYGANASTTSSCIPFYGSYANDARTISQYIIPATELADVAGGTVRSLTYYTNSTPNWGTATVKVYVKEVDYTTFAASSAEAVEDWETMTQVYNGSLTVSNGQMTITFDDTYFYGGGNLMIGIKMDQTGTSASVSWSSIYNSSAYTGLYAYYSTSYYSTGMSYNRSNYYPKTTINYQPTPYKKPVIDEASCTFETTSAHIAWTVTGATPTGYQYQYKPASATEWPSAWTSVTTAAADLSGLTPGSSYDFRVKALYDGGNESFAVDYSFFTECTAVTAFPWKEDFEAYSTGDFSHPCWVNEHISGDGSSIFKVYTTTTGSNTTHQLQLPDQSDGTLTKLRLPEMTLPNNGYQFVIDVYRSSSYDTKTGEGIRVYASTNGEIDGATELAFIPRLYSVASGIIPAEATGNAWYTYELPIGMSGTCYIILRGESQYGSATYMDNLIVEEIPTCARPSELASSNVTNHSATIEWTAGDAEQTLWQIAYSKTNFDPNTANFDVTTVSTVDASTNPFTLDKILDPESTYYVYVRANCGTTSEPDFGPWSRKGINFTTLAATPAPSNFVATNPASEKVDMTWNAGGGDFESWEIYYVASDDAPEAPTATTTATVSNITTLPTTEAPYVLEGLDPVTNYYAWIRAKHVWNSETTYSDWVALTSSYFETLDACPTPTDLVATNLTSVSADLSWVGSDDVTEGYTVEYGEEGTYSVNKTEDFSDQTSASYNTAGELPDGWYSYNTNTSGYLPHVCNNYSYGNIDDAFGTGTNNYLIMTTNASDSYAYAIMPQVSDLKSLEFKYEYESTGTSGGTLTVGYVTDNTGYSTYVPLQTPSKTGSIPKTYSLPASDIATINNAHGYVAFCYESASGTFYSVAIDDVTVKGGTYTPGATQTAQAEGTSLTIGSLSAGKTYIVKVKSNCTNGEYCEPVTFTTLADGNKVFTNAAADGKWGTAGNWAPAQLPVSTDEVILRANATIESGCVAEAKSITFQGTPTPTLTIADGGQLITNTAVTATVQKVINAHGETTADGGWYFIASPINSSYYSATSTGLNLITDNYGSNIPEGQTASYDLYSFLQNPTLDENGVGNEWRNYRKSTFSLANGKGYLYASLNGTTLNFTGSIKAATASGAVSLNYAAESELTDMSYRGWNLVGNPFTFETYVNMSYYKMNEDGSAVEPVDAYQTTAIAPCTGIMVQATESDQSVTFSKDAPSSQTGNQGNLNIALAQANVRNNSIMDKAILSFNEGSQLSKFYFGQNKANIYFPQDNEPLAIVSSEGQGEMPLNFKAYENGSYTLSFGSQNASFNYLRLIDNLTGAEVDLLQTPSYTFNATTTDYESRFKLVFCTGVNDDSDSFAFCSNGNWIINNDGEAILQVIDVTGRILSSETVNGSVSKAIHAAPGVYMLRLINGDNVKVQKIVVK